MARSPSEPCHARSTVRPATQPLLPDFLALRRGPGGGATGHSPVRRACRSRLGVRRHVELRLPLPAARAARCPPVASAAVARPAEGRACADRAPRHRPRRTDADAAVGRPPHSQHVRLPHQRLRGGPGVHAGRHRRPRCQPGHADRGRARRPCPAGGAGHGLRLGGAARRPRPLDRARPLALGDAGRGPAEHRRTGGLRLQRGDQLPADPLRQRALPALSAPHLPQAGQKPRHRLGGGAGRGAAREGRPPRLPAGAAARGTAEGAAEHRLAGRRVPALRHARREDHAAAVGLLERCPAPGEALQRRQSDADGRLLHVLRTLRQQLVSHACGAARAGADGRAAAAELPVQPQHQPALHLPGLRQDDLRQHAAAGHACAGGRRAALAARREEHRRHPRLHRPA